MPVYYLAARAAGHEILTLEGLSDGDSLHPIQQAWVEERALQCAYCTPGFVLSVKALLAENADPSDDEIREYLAGNLCRCAGYAEILRAVRAAQEKIKLAAAELVKTPCWLKDPAYFEHFCPCGGLKATYDIFVPSQYKLSGVTGAYSPRLNQPMVKSLTIRDKFHRCRSFNDRLERNGT